MYNQPYFIPNYYANMSIPSMMRGAASIGSPLRGTGIATRALNGIGAKAATAGTSHGLGLFSRLSGSLSALRGINWGGFINNASKTLGVINQTIPLVQQVGPMMTNMKSMLKVASLFKDETDNQSRNSRKRINYQPNSNNYQTKRNSTPQQITNIQNNTTTKTDIPQENSFNYQKLDSSPTFFIT